MRTTTTASGVLALAASFVLLGCGGDDPAPTPGAVDQPGAQAPAAAPAPSEGVAIQGGNIPAPMQAFSDDGNVAELSIEGDDRIRFNTDRLNVQAGQMVRLTLNHTGSLPAQAMGHNWVLLFAGDDAIEFGADVGQEGGSAANDFVPESLRDRVIAMTAMIGGGQSAVVEFQAPSEPGEYPFLCSFPGHFGQMNGILVVE